MVCPKGKVNRKMVAELQRFEERYSRLEKPEPCAPLRVATEPA
jgi:hypothetical protein